MLGEVSKLLCYEVTRDLSLDPVTIETPVAPMEAKKLSGKKLVFAPILRSGLGFLDGMLDMIPSARVAHIGLYRDPETLEAVEYYFKAPTDSIERLVIALDPMLATGHSAVAAIDLLKSMARAKSVSSACSPRRRGLKSSIRNIPTCASGQPQSTTI